MKSRRLFAAVVLAVLVALALAIPAGALMSAGGTTGGKTPLAVLKANLTGEQEVPEQGDPNGSGRAVVKVFKAKVCYTLKVDRIAPANAAHIHRGVRGVAGPVVVTLEPPTDGSSSGCVAISHSLSQKLREHPARYYVNVHNDPFPDGAIRGQLHHR